MIGRLLKHFSRTPPAPPAYVPEGSRVYAIGDVHGRLDLLHLLRDRILADADAAAEPRKVLVHLGDYVDRGLESRQVIDLLLDEPMPGFEEVRLRGNHEAVMLRFLDDISVGPGWLRFGGSMTLRSYGIPAPAGALDETMLTELQLALRERLPDRHREFLQQLGVNHVEGDYFFTHAGVRPEVPLDSQDPEDLIWIRDEFLSSDTDFGKVVVHGHSVSDRPQLRSNRIGIDTGAYYTGRLTCLVLEGGTRRFLQT